MRHKPSKLLWKMPVKLAKGLQHTKDALLVELLHDVVCINPSTGEKLFTQKPDSWTSYKALLQNDELLVMRQTDSAKTVLDCLSSTTGALRWQLSLPGSAYQADGLDDLFVIPNKGVLYVYQLVRQGEPHLMSLHELPLPALPYGEFNSTFLEESKRLVGVSSNARSLVFNLHDGSKIWEGEHQLQRLTPQGWFAQRANKYPVDVFDPAGNLLQSFLDPRCSSNNPHTQSTNGRGYHTSAANEKHLAFSSKYFSRTSGFGANNLFLARRGESAVTKVHDGSVPCVFLGDDLIYVGGYGTIRALDDQYQTIWAIDSNDWVRLGFKQTIISHLLPVGDKLFGLSFDDAFCLG